MKSSWTISVRSLRSAIIPACSSISSVEGKHTRETDTASWGDQMRDTWEGRERLDAHSLELSAVEVVRTPAELLEVHLRISRG